MRTLVVVQARTGSSRLPGKVLMPAAGAPLLARMLERVQSAKTPFELVVATTTDVSDDAVVSLARELGVAVHRGHPTDLLGRHVTAARELAAEPDDLVAKIPSDCPLIDPGAIDLVLGAWEAGLDYVSNLHPPTWPDGHDVEVLPFSVLLQAHDEARRPHEREHTTPFVWDQPERFRLRNVAWPRGLDYAMSHRMTLDYPEDYALVSAVYDALYRPGEPVFSLDDVLALLEARPDLRALNAKLAGVNWYRHHLDDLRTVTPEETRWQPT